MTEPLATNHERIWLQPLCCVDERCWSNDSHDCEDCGLPAIEYVRADLVAEVKPPLLMVNWGAKSIEGIYKTAAFQWDLAKQDHNEALGLWKAGVGPQPTSPDILSKKRDDYIIAAIVAFLASAPSLYPQDRDNG